MTRKEQIKQAAEKSSEHISDWVWNFAYRAHFIEGAMWADEHPQWISVDDELPQYGTYLVATEGNVVEISLYDIDGWDNWHGGNVTHWMPIVPPKKGDEQ